MTGRSAPGTLDLALSALDLALSALDLALAALDTALGTFDLARAAITRLARVEVAALAVLDAYDQQPPTTGTAALVLAVDRLRAALGGTATEEAGEGQDARA